MCINFSIEMYFTNFLLYMNIFALWCQLPHPPVVSIIVVYKNKAKIPSSCRISLIYFLHIFTIVKVFNNCKKENI